MMNCSSNIESGLQFLSRIKVRPTLLNIEKKLFPNGLLNNETVELCGNLSSGKTLLLTQLIAKCILLDRYDDKLIGGLGINVVFINTDHHFMILKLRDLLVEILKKNGNNSINQLTIENIVKKSMSNLIIINCYTNMQYSLTLQTLNDIILENDKIGLVLIDSIAAYYWQDRENGSDWMMDRYIQNILKIIQKHTFTSKIPLIYTKSINEQSKTNEKYAITCVNNSILGEINYRIKLIRSDDGNKFTCVVHSSKCNSEISYVIGASGIIWNNDTKRRIDSLNSE